MRVLVAALLLLLAVAPAARADTIVFRRGADIWRMAPDGSGQVALTGGERRYEWPSAADDGTIVASDETGRLYRLSRDGVEQGEPIPTAATVATEDAPAETPTHVRISPDGARIAYDEVIDGDVTTLWTPATATGLDFPGQSAGQAGLIAPSWVGSGVLLLSRDVASSDLGATFSLYGVGGGDNSADPWFSDDTATWATGFDAAASRDGTRIAIRPHRLTLLKRGLRARVTVSAPTTVRLTVRGRGVKRTVTRKLANAGTTPIRLRLSERTAKRARRLVLRLTAPGATPVTTTIRPRT